MKSNVTAHQCQNHQLQGMINLVLSVFIGRKYEVYDSGQRSWNIESKMYSACFMKTIDPGKGERGEFTIHNE